MANEAQKIIRALLGAPSPRTWQKWPKIKKLADDFLRQDTLSVDREIFTIWGVGNRTSEVFFQSKDDATAYITQTPLTAGLQLFPIQVIPSSKN